MSGVNGASQSWKRSKFSSPSSGEMSIMALISSGDLAAMTPASDSASFSRRGWECLRVGRAEE